MSLDLLRAVWVESAAEVRPAVAAAAEGPVAEASDPAQASAAAPVKASAAVHPAGRWLHLCRWCRYVCK